jgi:hypothetical protein
MRIDGTVHESDIDLEPLHLLFKSVHEPEAHSETPPLK